MTQTPGAAARGRPVAEAAALDGHRLVVVAGVEEAHAPARRRRAGGWRVSASGVGALVLEVDDDVGDRQVVALARAPHDLALEPRPSAGAGGSR